MKEASRIVDFPQNQKAMMHQRKVSTGYNIVVVGLVLKD